MNIVTAARVIFFTVTTAALFATTGCGILDREEDGDQPPTLAEYRVSLTPSLVQVNHDFPGVFTQEITLSVTCAGENVSDCDVHIPNWRVSYGLNEHAGLTASVLEPNKPNTVATIRVNPSLLYPGRADGNKYTSVEFTPTPPSRLTLTGRQRVDVVVEFPVPGGNRQATTADEPRLLAFPNPVTILFSLGQQPPTYLALAGYKGPPTLILAIGLGGRDANKFSLSRPTLPITVEGSFIFTYGITFVGTTDTGEYEANVTIVTANNATLTVPITAHRN